ncbi:MAG: quinoprotein relay system zinc metallohydrolase 2 [Shinella sp.]|nr:quinoprotein relay system zinc metallohydrolase 2 [Shinella sp.]
MRRPILRRSLLASGMAFAATGLPFSFSRPAGASDAVLAMTHVADGVYAFAGRHDLMTAANRGEICNVGFVVGDEAVAVVDSGGSAEEGRALVAAVHAVTKKPIRYLINTHMHPDHVFGNAAFEDVGAIIVGHRNLPRALKSRGEFYLESYRQAMGDALMADIRIVLPSRTIAQPEEIDLGERKLLLTPWRPAHTDNDLTVFDRTTRTLFTGDLCFNGHIPTLDGSLKGWLGQLDGLAAIDAAAAIPGHGPVPAAWPAALEPERRYFEVLAADIRQAIAKGIPISEASMVAAKSERSNWQLFDEHNARNATAAYAELEWE